MGSSAPTHCPQVHVAGRGSQGSALSSPQSGSDSSSRYGCYGASFLLLFLAGRPGRARGGRGTAACTREVERSDQLAKVTGVFLPTMLTFHSWLVSSLPLTLTPVQAHTHSGCRAGFQRNVLAGAAAVPGRAAIRAQMIRNSSQAPGEFQKAG